jgi:hypothetical protein
MKKTLDSYTGSLVHLDVINKEKKMKSRSFKTRQEMIDYLQEGGDYKGVPKIKKVKCGMDMLVESLREEKCCTICESAKVRGELGCQEGDYWEMKAEIHYGI